MSGAGGIGRPEWRELPIYRPESGTAAVDLSDNTSRFGVPPSALAVLRDPATADVARYPDAYGAPLREALAAYAGVDPEAIVTGCGSDDVLDSSIRAFGRPGARFAFLDPTFPMAPLFARLNSLEPRGVPLAADGRFDPDALLADDPAVVYLCSPNNPTGGRLDPDAVDRVIARAPGVVLLDEAYAEFAGLTRVADAPRTRGLLVTRTLSKAFGLAGLRVGWACGSPEMVLEVERSRGPFTVNRIAERAATAAVRHDVAWVLERAAEAVRLRDRLAGALRERGLSPLPSAANFLLVPLPGAPRIAAAMLERGVAVRAFEGLTGVGDAIRIHAAPWPELERALAALVEAIACG
jgi:histidinol-phosphate aminotransferase